MSTFSHERNKIYPKLRKLRGGTHISVDIPYIDTLAGRFHAPGVLEGFKQNTEILCNEDSHCSNAFYEMCCDDNEVVSEITEWW